jgi:hypothetical protein
VSLQLNTHVTLLIVNIDSTDRTFFCYLVDDGDGGNDGDDTRLIFKNVNIKIWEPR